VNGLISFEVFNMIV